MWGIREQKDPSLPSKRIGSQLIPALWRQLFFLLFLGGEGSDGWREGGRAAAEEFDGGDADFKVIFNFKPCGPLMK